MNTVLDNKCPSCGSPIVFDPKSGCFKCSHCKSVYKADEIKNMDDKKQKVDENDQNIDDKYVTYSCPDCGAAIIADEETSATFCIYCGNSSIIKNRLTGKFAPSKIIPFKKDKIDAVEAFKKLKKGRPFIPKEFLNENNIEKIRGVYIPFWLFNIESSGYMETRATKVKSWTIGNTRYTKTDFYDVVREANMSFLRIPVDGSTRFDDDIMNTIEPFDYSELEDYNHAYLSGFLAEKYNVESDNAYKDAIPRMEQSTVDVLLNSINGYATKKVKTKKIDNKELSKEYVLLPVYMVNIKYQDKYYLFAMNGQTGEFVGNIPIDKKKVLLWAVISFFGFFLLTVLLFYLFYLGGR